MKSVLITGGNGLVGRFIVDDLIAHGWCVTIAGRNAPGAGSAPKGADFYPLDLHPESNFLAATRGFDAVVHAGFSHITGQYRGGEGGNVKGFWDRNFLSSLQLFEAARKTGLARAIFLSSRAVYGHQPPGLSLTENTPCHPDTHYGLVKRACEQYLQKSARRTGWCTTSLRVTGVYGNHANAKWKPLLTDYLAGREISSRVATEVHGRDVASAVRQILMGQPERVGGQVFNVSDLIVDRHDILAPVRRHFSCKNPLPAPADASALNVMDTAHMTDLGWKPGGKALFNQAITDLIADQSSPS